MSDNFFNRRPRHTLDRRLNERRWFRYYYEVNRLDQWIGISRTLVYFTCIFCWLIALSYLYPQFFNLGVWSSVLLITSLVFVAFWIMSSQKGKRGRKAREAIEIEQAGLRTYTNKVNKKVYLTSTSLLPSRPLEEETEPIINLNRIKKEPEEVPVIKQEVLETCDNDVSNNLGDGTNAGRILQSSEIANIEKGVNTKSIFSVSHLSLDEEKSDSSVQCAASHQTCLTAENLLDIGNIKREPRSRSSSTETVVADEVPKPVQIPEDSETFQSSSNKRPLGITNEVSKKMKTLSSSPDEHCATDKMEVDPNIHEHSLNPSPKNGSITVKSEYDINSSAGDSNRNASAVGKTCQKSDDTLFFFSNIKSTLRNIVQNYSVGSENSSGALNEETPIKASSICSTNRPFSSKNSTIKPLSSSPGEHCSTSEMEVDTNVHEHRLNHSPKKCNITVKSEYNVNSSAANAGDCNKNSSTVGKTCHSKKDDALSILSNIKSSLMNIVQNYSLGFEHSSGTLNDETPNKANMSPTCSTNYPVSGKNSTMKPLSSLPDENFATSEMEVDTNIHANEAHFSPIFSTNSSFSSEKHTIPTGNTYKNFMKIMNCNVKIVSTGVKDCLKFLKEKYTVKKKFELYFNNDHFESQHNKSALEPVKPSADSFSSTEERNVSTKQLKKILLNLPKDTESLPNYPCSAINNKSAESVKLSTDSVTCLEERNVSIEELKKILENLPKGTERLPNYPSSAINNQSFDQTNNIRIKKEPLGDFTASTASKELTKSEGLKTSFEETVFTKKIKTEPPEKMDVDAVQLGHNATPIIHSQVSTPRSLVPQSDLCVNLNSRANKLQTNPNVNYDFSVADNSELGVFTPSTASKELTKSEGLKTSFEETILTKKIKTEPPEKIDVDAVPLDHNMTPVIHSKVSKTRSLALQSDLCVNMSSARAIKLQNNPNVSYDSSVADKGIKLGEFTPFTVSKKLTKSVGLKTSFDEIFLTKKIKTKPLEKIDADAVPLDHNVTPVIHSKVSKNRSLALQSNLCVNMSSHTIKLQNNPNVNYDCSVTDNKRNKQNRTLSPAEPTTVSTNRSLVPQSYLCDNSDSRAKYDFSVTECGSSNQHHTLSPAKPAKVSTNRSLVPQSYLCDNSDSRAKYDFSVTECRNTKQNRTLSSAKPRKVSTNRSLAPQSDLFDNLDSSAKYDFSVSDYKSSNHAVSAAKPIKASKNRSLVPQRGLYDNLDTSAMTKFLHLVPRSIDKTKNPTNIFKNISSLQDDKYSNEASATSTCKRINPLAQPVSTFSNSTTARKKIRPKTSVKRISLHDPRVKKNSNPNSIAQVSSRGISETTLKQPDHQTKNLTFTANSRKTHRCKKYMSTCTSNVQQKCLKNAVSSQSLSVTSESKRPVKLVSYPQTQDIAKTSSLIKNPSRKEPKLPLKYRSVGPSSTEFQK